MSKIICLGADIDTEFPTVLTAGECVNLCKHREHCMNAVYDFYRFVIQFIYLFGVLCSFQHCMGHIRTGSFVGSGNQYIQDQGSVP